MRANKFGECPPHAEMRSKRRGKKAQRNKAEQEGKNKKRVTDSEDGERYSLEDSGNSGGAGWGGGAGKCFGRRMYNGRRCIARTPEYNEISRRASHKALEMAAGARGPRVSEKGASKYIILDVRAVRPPAAFHPLLS
jgi:hypothetical protein